MSLTANRPRFSLPQVVVILALLISLCLLQGCGNESGQANQGSVAGAGAEEIATPKSRLDRLEAEVDSLKIVIAELKNSIEPSRNLNELVASDGTGNQRESDGWMFILYIAILTAIALFVWRNYPQMKRTLLRAEPDYTPTHSKPAPTNSKSVSIDRPVSLNIQSGESATRPSSNTAPPTPAPATAPKQRENERENILAPGAYEHIDPTSEEVEYYADFPIDGVLNLLTASEKDEFTLFKVRRKQGAHEGLLTITDNARLQRGIMENRAAYSSVINYVGPISLDYRSARVTPGVVIQEGQTWRLKKPITIES